MKKRLISLLLCLALMLSLLPVSASADPGTITSISISGVPEPEDGMIVSTDNSDLILGDSSLYSAYFWDYSWSCRDGIIIPDTEYHAQFQGGETYTLMLLIIPNDGVSGLDDETAPTLPVTINGKPAVYNPACKPELAFAAGKDVFAYQVEFHCPWTNVVSYIDIEGFLPPTPGVCPYEAYDFSVPEGAPYHIDSFYWWVYTGKAGLSDSKIISDTDVFEEGLVYYLDVHISLDDGYSYAKNLSYFFNGSSSYVDPYFMTTSGDSVRYFSEDLEAQTRRIDTIRIDNFENFREGNTVSDILGQLSIPDASPYSLHLEKDCSCSYKGTYLNDSDAFEYGKNYQMTFRVTPMPGWTIDEDTVWRINSGSVPILFSSAASNQEADYWYAKTAEIPTAESALIEEVFINGYQYPMAGYTPEDYQYLYPLSEDYEIIEIYWFCDREAHRLRDDEAFVLGKEYSCCAVVQAASAEKRITDDTIFILNDGDFDTASYGKRSNSPAYYVWTESYEAVRPVAIAIYLDASDEIATTGFEVPYGYVYGLPAEPSIEGYTFGGWYTDRALQTPYDSTAPITEPISLFPKWIPEGTPSEIEAIAIAGLGYPFAGNTAIECLPPFAGAEEYEITDSYWYCESTGKRLADNETFVSGQKYYACLTIKPATGQVITTNTAVSLNTGRISVGQFVLEPNNTCTIRTETFTAADPVLIGIYTDASDEYAATGIELLPGTVYGLPFEPGKSGYSFGGWYTDRDLLTPYDPMAPITRDINLFPKWIPSDNIISQVFLSGYQAPQSGKLPVTASDLSVPSDAHYSVSSVFWYEIPDLEHPDIGNIHSGPFIAGKAYSLTVCLEPDDGWRFSYDASISFIGGSADIACSDLDEDYFAFDTVVVVCPHSSNVIEKVSVSNLPLPCAGNSPASIKTEDLAFGGPNYHISEIICEEWSDDGAVSFSGPYESGHSYFFIIKLEAQPGNSFSGSVSALLNGTTPDGVFMDGNLLCLRSEIYRAEAYSLISSIDAVVPVPAAGQKPSAAITIKTTPSSGGVHVESIDWFIWDEDSANDNKWESISEDQTFEAGKQYAVDINVSATDGWKFEETLSGTINGKPSDTEYGDVYDSDTHAYLSYVWTVADPGDGPGPKDCPSAKFTDAPNKGNWAHAGIDYCVANGLMNGLSDTTFGPSGTVTRAQLVTILYRVAGTPAVEFKGTFADVPAGKWYSDAIEWAADNGIVNGTAPGIFNPMGNITREQIAAILYRYKNSPSVSGSLSDFPDSDTVHSYAKNALIWATQEGLINGIASNGITRLSPLTNASRAQIASIIMRFLNGNYECS